MSGISKTIPQKEGVGAMEQLYDGSISTFEFHMRGKPSRLEVGEYVYTIWQDALVGRCVITRMEYDVVNPDNGKKQTLIYVACPGERRDPPLPHKGHRGTRYYDGVAWEESI